MSRSAVAVRSFFLSAISRLAGLSSARTSLKFVVVVLAVLLPGSLIFFATIAGSQNAITVNNGTDPSSTSGNGFCTLREAINNADSPGTDTTGGDCVVGTGTDVISFSASVTGTITLNGVGLEVENALSISGPGASALAISNGGFFAPIFVTLSGATVSISGLTIENGTASEGAGIFNGGTLTLTNVIVSGNTAEEFGGGIDNIGTLTLTNSTVSGNSCSTKNGNSGGGGISNGGTLTLTSSTVNDNLVNSGIGGGGIANNGILTLTNSTVYDNTTGTTAGGIYNAGTMTVTDATVAGNVSSTGGGGIDEISGGTATLKNTIVAESFLKIVLSLEHLFPMATTSQTTRVAIACSTEPEI